MLLRLDDVAKHVGPRTLFRGVSLELRQGDRMGLIGPNGAGKTTLLRIAAGEETPDAGAVVVPRASSLGILRQEIDPRGERSVHDEVHTALERLAELEREMREMEGEMERAARAGRDVPEALAERYDRCRVAFEFGGGFERESRVDRVLEGLGFDAEARARPLRTFSGGWLMRVELAKLLLSAPDVLLLDEPTNHLDLPSIQWFEETLASYGGAVLVISHDRAFLRRHATRIAELEAGRFEVYEGGFDRFLRQKEERREQLLARRRAQDREIEQTQRFVDRFRAKASKARQVQSRIKALDRIERIELGPEDGSRMRLRIPPPARAGEVVLRLEGIHKAYGAQRVYEGVDLLVRRGDRVALVGPNGAGKSTLLRIAAGVLPHDAGERTLGHNVRVAFFAQHQLEALDPSRSALEELASVAHTDDHPRLRGHLGAFLFTGDDVEKKVSVLSGGEKSRLALARLLLRPTNFLVLDEPTNHLDVVSCGVLEEALRAYEGTLLFISHDRDFIDAIATRVVEVERGALTDYPGNYADYRASRAKRASGAERASGAPESAATSGDARSATPPTEGRDARSKQERIRARERAKERARRLARSRKRLSEIEEQIVRLEAHLETLAHRLGDPELYRDGEAVRVLESERGETQANVDALYRDWERVAAEIESAEQAPA